MSTLKVFELIPEESVYPNGDGIIPYSPSRVYTDQSKRVWFRFEPKPILDKYDLVIKKRSNENTN
jgi:hypothetical protein